MLRPRALLASLAVVSALSLVADRADACGGCFVAQTENTVVTGHRMAFAISPAQTVLWDQIQYSGSPEDFAWVLPVQPGAFIEVASDAFFEALEAGTAVQVGSPPVNCPSRGGGFGCGMADDGLARAGEMAGGPGGVTVVHEGTVGPYDTVTLSADQPGALNTWLETNGYSVPDGIQPTLDAYVAEGFDFIALKLSPGQGVKQMKPVRVVTKGASPALPLRMIAAGSGPSVSLILYVLGEGRWRARDFADVLVPPELLVWDFRAEESNYATLRKTALAAEGGRAWLTTYAQERALLSPIADPLGFGGFLRFSTSPTSADFQETIAAAFAARGVDNGEILPADTEECRKAFLEFEKSGALVVDPCDPDGTNCTPVAPGELDARKLACGALDDVAVALTGMHPRDVWLTRIEAELPRDALDGDLVLEPGEQAEVWSRMRAELSVHLEEEIEETCGAMVPPLGGRAGRGAPPASGVAVVIAGLAALALGLALRRAARPVLA